MFTVTRAVHIWQVEPRSINGPMIFVTQPLLPDATLRDDPACEVAKPKHGMATIATRPSQLLLQSQTQSHKHAPSPHHPPNPIHPSPPHPTLTKKFSRKPTLPLFLFLFFSSSSVVKKLNFFTLWELRSGGLLRVIRLSFSSLAREKVRTWVFFRSRLP